MMCTKSVSSSLYGGDLGGAENTGAKMYGKPSEQKITGKAWKSLAYSSLGAVVSPPSEY